MNFEIYIYQNGKQESFYKAAMAEYEKRLTRYCKLKVKYIKKEKDLERLLFSGDDAYLIGPGKEQLSSEEMSRWIGNEESQGRKKMIFIVPGDELTNQWEDRIGEHTELRRWSLSDFNMNPMLESVILEEQIYRSYRILHNHPYHK